MKKLVFILMLMLMSSLLCCSREPRNVTDRGLCLAKINDVPIYSEDVKKEFNMLPEQIRQLYMSENGIESLIDELVKKELLYQEARKRGYHNKDAFARQVKEFRKRLMIEHLLKDEIESKAVVTEKNVRDFYESNVESFAREVPGEDKTEAIDFEMVKDLIMERLVADRQKEIFDSYIESLEKNNEIELNRESIIKTFGNGPTS
jgi:hypothetical protein